MTEGPTASVVIPTRERPAALARCIAALRRCDGAERLEVVVVDDGPGRTSTAAVAPRPFAALKLLRTGGSGPAAARNVGARASAGAVICFLDDDCEPDPEWALSLLGPALEAGAAAGRTVNAAAGAAPAAAQLITNGLLYASLDRRSGTLAFAPSCNLALRRDVALAVPFDPSFPLAGGEDRDWSARALEAGFAPVYEPGAVVYHRHSTTLTGFLRQQYRYGRGGVRFRRAGPGRTIAPLRYYSGLARSGLAEGPAACALLLGAQLASAGGALAESASRGSPRS